jgi:hypothetical protein
MTIRFSVERMYDLASREGLLVSGWILGGVITPGMTLGDGAGLQTTVLTVEFESPEDRRTGQTTMLLERTTPSPVAIGSVLTVEETLVKPVRFGYLAIRRSDDLTTPVMTVLVSEVTLGPPRTILFNRPERIWEFDREFGAMYRFDPKYQERTERISRTDAERMAIELGTELPSETELHRLMLIGEAQANHETS